MIQRRETPPDTGQLTLDEVTVHDLRVIASSLLTEHGIQERFEAFHARHPEVYAGLLRLCREWRAAGRTAWSIKGAFEVLRWERHIGGLADPAETWRLNNNYTALYARKLIDLNPELQGLFELRERRS